MQQAEVQVLDDHIIHTLAGTLITTTWEFFYGDIQQSILSIKKQFEQYAIQRSLVAYEGVIGIKRSYSCHLRNNEVHDVLKSKKELY